MIELRRASAGSGKTYTLAKTFISLYIGMDTPMGRRLREPDKLHEALGHIMGVTFTNKATNEMKARIVDKLAALAHPEAATGRIDYQEDFMQEFGVGAEELARTCRRALAELLHNYSDFQIATIDSFFQSILRAFTYETEISQNYQVEIDDNYMLRIGVNDTLSKIKEKSEDADNIRHILSRYISASMENGNAWNIFNADEGDGRTRTLYGNLLDFARQLTKETFKNGKEEAMRNFYAEHPDFRHVLSELSKNYDIYLRQKMEQLTSVWRLLAENFSHAGLDIMETGSRSVATFAKWIANNPDSTNTDRLPKPPTASASGVFNSKNKKLSKSYDWTPLLPPIADAFEEWRMQASIWSAFRSKLHFLGLMQPIMQAIAEFREENNLVQLSDTSTILNKIINDADAPFIYEKTGYYLHHYLIDEFQDTSKLQWMNIHPLLSESVANSNANLIIGDAKQSIYRFRNADSSLITTQVKADFGDNCIETGTTSAENTNHRSADDIVRFNNTLYSVLPEMLDMEGRKTLSGLYSTSAQDMPQRQTAKRGYVKVLFLKEKKTEESRAASIAANANIVQQLLHRGYRQKDITFLVRTNKQGEQLIEAMLDHNAENEGKADYIPMAFVSEESLGVGSSFAVKLILSALGRTALSDAFQPETTKETEKENDKRYIDPERFERRLRSFESRNPELSAAEALEAILASDNEDPSEDSPQGLRTLPALVEWIIARHLPEHLRKEHACFIAAFQDIVLDYCEAYPTDTASFLKWWKNNGGKFSVQSPADTDAIRVMTIHKAKGLESTCVLLPFAGSKMPDMDETAWVRPCIPEEVAAKCVIPPYMPIDLSAKKLKNTPYERMATLSAEEKNTDELNTLYVSTTRAVRELYMTVWNGTSDIQKNLMSVLASETPPATTLRPDLATDPGLWHFQQAEKENEPDILEYGIAGLQPEIKDEYAVDNRINDYQVNPDFEIMFHTETDNGADAPYC